MTTLRKCILHCGMVAATLAATGCMATRGNRVGVPTPWPLDAKEPRAISVAFRPAAVIGGRQMDVPERMLALWRAPVLRAYREAGRFSDVRTGLGGSDLQVEVGITNSGDPNVGLAFLSGLTMMIVPAYAVDQFTMHTTIRDAEGNVRAQVERSDDITTWMQLFLIFGAPFATPKSAVEATLYDMTRASIADLDRQGAWAPAASTGMREASSGGTP